MRSRFDVVVAGGSVAGLAFAAEAGRRGLSVLVAEEHEEIGEPEKCDGLVSLRGLNRFGFPPDRAVIQNRILAGVVHTPAGRSLAIGTRSLEVVVLDRSAYDKQLAATAEGWGAELRTGTRASALRETASGVEAKVGDQTLATGYFVDATGPASAPRRGIIPAAKYELEADWVNPTSVEVFLDAEEFPGFFAWVIPYGGRKAKVGAAGRGINAFKALDGFLANREHRILRKVAAPIYVGGPASSFVAGRRLSVGESAGQVKPTTAGGIMTSVAGAAVAAKWVAKAAEARDPTLLAGYQPEWEAIFLKEMRGMLRLRGFYERLTNRDLEAVFSAVATPKVVSKLSRSDFDFHATAVLGAIGLGGLIRMASVVASSEARSLITGR